MGAFYILAVHSSQHYTSGCMNNIPALHFGLFSPSKYYTLSDSGSIIVALTFQYTLAQWLFREKLHFSTITRCFENWSFPPTLGGNEVLYCNGMPGNLTSNRVRFTVEALIYHYRESKAHLNFSSLLYPYLFISLEIVYRHFLESLNTITASQHEIKIPVLLGNSLFQEFSLKLVV